MRRMEDLTHLCYPLCQHTACAKYCPCTDGNDCMRYVPVRCFVLQKTFSVGEIVAH